MGEDCPFRVFAAGQLQSRPREKEIANARRALQGMGWPRKACG